MASDQAPQYDQADTVSAETISTADKDAEKPSAPSVPSAANRGGRPSKSRGAPKSSDKGEDRWTIRGVPTNVRRLALAEAERRGLTLGDFVAEALVGYLKAKSAEEPVSAAKDVTVPKPEEMAGQIAQILDRMTALETQRRSLWSRLFG